MQAVTRRYDPWEGFGANREKAVLAGILPEKPAAMSSNQWGLIQRMCCLDPHDRPSASDVVRQLKVLIPNKTPIYESTELNAESFVWTNLGDMHIDELSRVTVANAITEAIQLCEGTTTMDTMNRDAVDRLVDVFESLKTRTNTAQPGIVQQFVGILRYYRKRLQSTKSVRKAQAARFASSRRGAADTYSVHQDLDSFMDTALLPRSLQLHQWRDTWKDNRSRQQHEIMEKLNDFGALLEDVYDEREREEALTYLRFELSKNPTSYVGSNNNNLRHLKSTISSIWTFKNANWFIPSYEVEFDKYDEFSSGAFGSVHRGTWKHAQVVVKKLKLERGNDRYVHLSDTFDSSSLFGESCVDAEVQATFLNEVQIWHKLYHPHVVQLFGACHIGQPFFVCEYAGGGQLDSYLREHPGEIWGKMHEAALGLRYLHMKRVIHGSTQ